MDYKMLLYVYLGLMALMGVVAFISYGRDKKLAQKGAFRTPERTLLLLAFCGGCVGALFGMLLCRHKTKHARFVILVPLSVLLWAAAFVLFVLFSYQII